MRPLDPAATVAAVLLGAAMLLLGLWPALTALLSGE
jgi:hypothetical protein